MWIWSNPEHTSAWREVDGVFESCGIDCEPLKSWVFDGNEPDEYVEVKSDGI